MNDDQTQNALESLQISSEAISNLAGDLRRRKVKDAAKLLDYFAEQQNLLLINLRLLYV